MAFGIHQLEDRNWTFKKNVAVTGTSTFTGAVTSGGDLTASTDFVVSAVSFTASGTISNASHASINPAGIAGSIAAMTHTPVAGQFLVLTQTGSGTVTVTLNDSATYDGSNSVATFNADGETLVLFGLSSSRYVIVENIGSVALS